MFSFTSILRGRGKFPLRIAVVVIVAYWLALGFIFFDEFEPYLFPLHWLQKHLQVLNDRIILGPCPHRKELIALKRSGVNVIVSLLNTNLPPERALYNRLVQRAQKMGFQVVSFPMDFMDLDRASNRQTALRLVEFVRRHPEWKFYIHCYLGKHRTEYVKRFLLHPPASGKASQEEGSQ